MELFNAIRKPIYGVLLLLFFFIGNANAQFTAGRLVVEQMGDGSAALSSASTPIFLKEFTIAGIGGISVAIPTTGASALTSSGSATSEGLMTRSYDGQFILIPGYNTVSGTAGIAGTSTATVPRAVGEVNSAGAFSIPVTTTSFSSNNPRGVAGDGFDVWGSGANSGVVLEAASGAGTITSSTITNLRALEIFNGQLYVSASSGVLKGIGTVGVGTPTTTFNTTTQIMGVAASSPYEFSISPGGNIAYVADDAAGIQKWVNTAGTWSLAYVLNTTKSRGLVVDYSSANITTGIGAIVYATDAVTTSANAIFSVTDAGAAGATATIITRAVANTVFRGLAFTPATPNLIIAGTATYGIQTSTADTYIEGAGPVTTATPTASFAVSGANLTSDVVITAPADYEVGTNPNIFASTVILANAGTLSMTAIFFRLKAGLVAGNYNNENVTINSAGVPQPGNVLLSGSVSTVLPVKISSVTAAPQNNNVAIQWQVESEINVNKYEIQRSVDGKKFNTIDTVVARGNNITENLSYSCLDINAVSGVNYYRIRSVDNDGAAAYSQIVQATISTGNVVSGISVYPNPVVNHAINLQINNKPAGNYTISVYTNAGQLLLTKTISYAGNNNVQLIDLPNTIGAGIYQLLVTDPANNNTAIKIIL